MTHSNFPLFFTLAHFSSRNSQFFSIPTIFSLSDSIDSGSRTFFSLLTSLLVVFFLDEVRTREDKVFLHFLVDFHSVAFFFDLPRFGLCGISGTPSFRAKVGSSGSRPGDLKIIRTLSVAKK